VPEEINQTLNRIADIRKVCDDLGTVDGMNLWPSADCLIQIERKFSQSLSVEDIAGEEAKPAKKAFQGTAEASKTIKLL
jgi:hypothetical protein